MKGTGYEILICRPATFSKLMSYLDVPDSSLGTDTSLPRWSSVYSGRYRLQPLHFRSFSIHHSHNHPLRSTLWNL